MNTIMHFGAPRSSEDYFQESGRGGRSGCSARSVVFSKPRDCPVKSKPSTAHDHELIEVRQHLENKTECRRRVLLSDISTYRLKHLVRKPINVVCDVCSNRQE